MLTYKELSSSKASQVEDLHVNAVAERFRRRYDNAFTTFYDLDEEQIKLFSNLIGRYVKLGKTLKSSQHPIASALNEYARIEANKINNGSFLNIGGNPSKEKGLHYCNLVNDCRNEARLMSAGHSCCFEGAQNCSFKSNFAVAVDSLYDVPFEEIYTIFDKHSIKVLHAWMFLPLELIDDDVAKIPNPLFRLNSMDEKGIKVAFSFVNDFSAVYIHDKINWAKYLKNTAIIGDDFCIDIEIVRTYGPFCHLIFKRVSCFKPSTRVLPFFDFYNNFIKIPDYRFLVCNGFNVKYKKLPKIVVPKYVFQKLYSYVTRGPDNSFSYERGATYFHGITSKIIIGNQVYVEDLGKLGHEYDDILFSVMCLAAQSRLRRTKNFGKFMRAIDNDFCSASSVPSNFINDVKDFFSGIFGKAEKRGLNFNISDSRDFMMFDFEFFENKYQNGFCDVRGIKSTMRDNFITRKHGLSNVDQSLMDNDFERCDSVDVETTKSLINDDAKEDQAEVSSITTIGSCSSLLRYEQPIEFLNDDAKTFKTLNLKKEFTLTQDDFNNAVEKRLTVEGFSLVVDGNKNEPALNFVDKSVLEVDNDNDSYITINIKNRNKIENVVENNESTKIESDNLRDCVIDNVIFDKLNVLTECGICNSSEIMKLQNYHAIIASDDVLYRKIKDYEDAICYSSYDGKLNRGAAKMRYMLDKYCPNWKDCKTFDVSLAPGGYGNLGFKKLDGGYFVGINHIKADKKLLNKYNKVFEYVNISELNLSKYDLILCDIGSEDHTVNVYDNLRNILSFNNRKVIVKFYLEHFKSCVKFCSFFRNVTIIKPAFSFSLNRELYAICDGFTMNMDHTDYVKAAFYSVFLSIIRAYEVYNLNIFPNNNKLEIKDDELIDVIKVSQDDVDDYVNDLIANVNSTRNAKEIGDFIGGVADKISNAVIDFNEIKVSICNGPPGASKSAEIISKVKNGDIIIVPTKELKDKYEKKIKYLVGKTSVKVSTMHKVFHLTENNFKNIFIDEASMQIVGYFALLKYYFPKALIHLYFDSEQIGTVDFNNRFISEEVDFERKYDYNRINSFRCPIDVSVGYTRPFNTFNKKIFSIVKLSYTNFAEKKFLRRLKVICLTQNTKKTLLDQGFNVNTVHEYQGGQEEHVVFYNDVNDAILSDRLPRHINVAMTRHSNTLIIVGEIQGNYDLCVQGSSIERMLEQNGRPATSEILMNDYSEGPLERLEAIKMCKIDEHVMYDIRDNYDVNRVIDIIGKFIDIYGVASDFKTVRTVDLPLVKQGKAYVNPDIVCKPELIERGRYLTEYNTARAYDSKDYFTATKTLLGRYGLKTKKFNSEQINEGVLLLEKGCNVWLKYNIDSVKFNEIMHTTQEEWSECFIDYCFKLNAKKNLKPGALDKDLTDIDQRGGLLAIDYFMKKQDKFDIDYYMILKQKLGQGVNSWGKTVNVVYASYCRLFGRKLRLCLKDNVVFANGLSDVEIGNKIAACISVGKVDGVRYAYAENDMEEYDTSQSEITIENECRWLKRMGCNDFFIWMYKMHRTEWRTTYIGYVSMMGFAKKHSGEPFTLDFNTLLCMCLNGLMFPLDKFIFASFKGDDSDIMADNIKVFEEGVRHCLELGFKTKLSIGDCSEFIGYIITPYGFYPDLLRVCCKLLNKRIADDKEGEAYFEELKLAAHDRLQVIDCYEVREVGRKMYMNYMNNKFKEQGRNVLLNANDVFELESFLFNFKNINYSDLIKCNRLHVFLNSI